MIMSNVFQGNHPAIQNTGIGQLAKEIFDRQVEEIKYPCKNTCKTYMPIKANATDKKSKATQ
jgi:hypothetical protein